MKMRGWKLRKIIVQGFNRVSEARLSAFKGGGLESSNTLSGVWTPVKTSYRENARLGYWRAQGREKRQPARPAEVVYMKQQLTEDLI